MRITLVIALCLLFIVGQAQTDELPTSNGSLKIRPVHHGALMLTWEHKTIFVDPYGGEKFKSLGKPDLILITDIHGDHFDTTTLNLLDTKDVTFIVPRAVADLMPGKFKKNLIVLENGGNTKWKGIDITAVPMYNLPEENDSRHPKGRGNGYILAFAGKKIYISGDTEDIAEMRSLKSIDVAFVCMNLPYTMSIEQAADAVKTFRPRIVYPYHYRGKEGLSDVSAFKKQVESAGRDIEVRLRNWYAE
jgi:L-ascorbate metabolism protein UlaG (beta-lactamase superfamily)